MSARLCVLSLALLGAMKPTFAHAPTTVVAIRNVTVIDGTGAAPLPDATVVIQGRRIEAIGPSRRVRIPPAAVVIEGRGRYLVPGFIDTHVHIASAVDTPRIERLLAFTLAYGITGVRDASGIGRERQLVDLRARIDRGDVLAPRLYVSGSGTPQNVTRYRAAGLADLIRRQRDLHVDGIKLRNLTSAQADTVIREARAAGLPVFGHTYGRGDNFTRRAFEEGATGVMHVAGIGPARTLQQRSLTATGWQRDWLELYLHWVDASAAEELQLLHAFLAAGAWLEPTLTAEAFVLHDDWYRDRPENRLLAQLWGQSYDQARSGFPAFTGADLELARQGFSRMQAFVRRFEEAGGLVLTGTDMLPWPAAGLHEELRLLVDAGLSPLAALQAATRNAAQALGWEGLTGTIEIGREADLVLLDGNPLEDITNTRQIRAVVRAGRVLSRATLDSLVAAADTAQRR
jgi:imidazolonepropionase-like amidohydrolase